MSHNVTEGIQVEDVTFTLDNAREVLCATQQAETNNFQFIHNIIYHNSEGLSHWLDCDHDGLMSVTVANEEVVTVPSHTSNRDFFGITLIRHGGHGESATAAGAHSNIPIRWPSFRTPF